MRRDATHMARVLTVVGRCWNGHPHLRLGQMLINASRYERELFYLEDEELERRLEIYPPTGVADAAVQDKAGRD